MVLLLQTLPKSIDPKISIIQTDPEKPKIFQTTLHFALIVFANKKVYTNHNRVQK